jgi:hypothetical protein
LTKDGVIAKAATRSPALVLVLGQIKTPTPARERRALSEAFKRLALQALNQRRLFSLHPAPASAIDEHQIVSNRKRWHRNQAAAYGLMDS